MGRAPGQWVPITYTNELSWQQVRTPHHCWATQANAVSMRTPHRCQMRVTWVVLVQCQRKPGCEVSSNWALNIAPILP